MIDEYHQGRDTVRTFGWNFVLNSLIPFDRLYYLGILHIIFRIHIFSSVRWNYFINGKGVWGFPPMKKLQICSKMLIFGILWTYFYGNDWGLSSRHNSVRIIRLSLRHVSPRTYVFYIKLKGVWGIFPQGRFLENMDSDSGMFNKFVGTTRTECVNHRMS